MSLCAQVEGSDEQIVHALPFERNERFRPSSIVFEFVLLSQERRDAANSRLQRFGCTRRASGFEDDLALTCLRVPRPARFVRLMRSPGGGAQI